MYRYKLLSIDRVYGLFVFYHFLLIICLLKCLHFLYLVMQEVSFSNNGLAIYALLSYIYVYLFIFLYNCYESQYTKE
jgi:hypothetical protein